ncbi:HEAT repeat domain-containing protein [Halosimplex rubrum]|uniref:HEAT repeat domain-containing protein n=1 Tax=Halosimplex rubrum TaxID=869889 RepID=A0A7D5SZL5_9EURY|nr:HEAT repeat domain-containing protein [Halosimplex rubrum]QLH77228.1 HEAT repeat domain-containing protein [Halosimplex rubrum]
MHSDISIKYPDAETIEIVIETPDDEDTSKEVSQFGSSGLQTPGGDILRSVFGIEAILRGEEVWLQRFTYSKYQLRSRPRNSDTSVIEVLKRQDETVKEAVVEKEGLCQAIVSAGKSYYEQVCGNGGREQMDDCDCAALEVGTEDGRRRLDYYREHGTQRGYTPALSREHLKTIVRKCEHTDRLREFVPRTDAVRSFVDELAASGDDKYVVEWYEDLLVRPRPEIPSEAAKALADNPDPRAKDALLQTRWKALPEVVPHAFRALAKLGSEEVRDALLDYRDFPHADETIRTATIEALGTFDEEEVRTTLQAIADDEDEPEAIREAARDALAAVDE